MKRLLLTLVFSLTALVLSSAAAEPRPNILFILADDLGWTGLSCYGNQAVATPNLDRLAAQGMRFTQAYADAQCSPTRAAFLSGQYGGRTGLFKVIAEKEPPKAYLRPPATDLAMPPDVATLARTLRGAGYATGLSGKWHIANNAFVAQLRQRDGGKYFDRYGFDFAGATNPSEHREDKAATAITDDIIGFIEAHRRQPWFAYAAHLTPHAPFAAPAALIEKHVARGYRRSSTPGGKYAERPTANYLAMLEHMDAQVGRLLRRLDELKLTDRTVVIFAGDNGGLSGGRISAQNFRRRIRTTNQHRGGPVPENSRKWRGKRMG